MFKIEALKNGVGHYVFNVVRNGTKLYASEITLLLLLFLSFSRAS
jgi:hypothetical protein